MDMVNAESWAFLIASASTTFLGLWTTLKVSRVQKQAETIVAKVDVVHDLTNSRLSRIEEQLVSAHNYIEVLHQTAKAAEEVRKSLAAEVVDTKVVGLGFKIVP